MRYGARKGRVSLRDTMAANLRALEVMDGGRNLPITQKYRAAMPAPVQPRIKRAPDPDAGPLEKHVLKAVLEALRRHPSVALAERRQAGSFMDGDRMIRVGSKGTLDISGCLKGSARYFEIECKRGQGGRTSPEQESRIAYLRSIGAIAGVVTSVEEAFALIS